jgi:hypothetical protein
LVGGVAAVPVEGGLLSYEVLDGAPEPVLAIHGVSSQRRLWNWLRSSLSPPTSGATHEWHDGPNGLCLSKRS